MKDPRVHCESDLFFSTGNDLFNFPPPQSSSLRQQTLLPSREIHQGVPVKDLHEALSLLQEEHNNMVDHISYLQGKVLSLKMRHEDLREEQSRW